MLVWAPSIELSEGKSKRNVFLVFLIGLALFEQVDFLHFFLFTVVSIKTGCTKISCFHSSQ